MKLRRFMVAFIFTFAMAFLLLILYIHQTMGNLVQNDALTDQDLAFIEGYFQEQSPILNQAIREARTDYPSFTQQRASTFVLNYLNWKVIQLSPLLKRKIEAKYMPFWIESERKVVIGILEAVDAIFDKKSVADLTNDEINKLKMSILTQELYDRLCKSGVFRSEDNPF